MTSLLGLITKSLFLAPTLPPSRPFSHTAYGWSSLIDYPPRMRRGKTALLTIAAKSAMAKGEASGGRQPPVPVAASLQLADSARDQSASYKLAATRKQGADAPRSPSLFVRGPNARMPRMMILHAPSRRSLRHHQILPRLRPARRRSLF